MTPVLVDSNVILDVAYEDPLWRAWSEAAIEQAAEQAALVINPIIYAQVSIGYAWSSMSRLCCLWIAFGGKRCRTRPPFSPGSPSWRTEGVAACVPRHCPTSTSGRTRRCPDIDCSPAMPRAIERIPDFGVDRAANANLKGAGEAKCRNI